MFKYLIKMIGHRAFSQATDCDKIKNFVLIIQGKTSLCH